MRYPVAKFGTPDPDDYRGYFNPSQQSFTDRYPDVPKPEPHISPILIALRWSAHDLYGEDMPGVAAKMLEAGLDSPSLRRLAGEMNVHGSREVEELVVRMFSEFSISYPFSGSQARHLMTRQAAREVIAGERDACAAASYIQHGIWLGEVETETLSRLFQLNDEISRKSKHRRSDAEIFGDLIDTLAKLGCE
jgi:hypothetical protein